MSTLVRDLFFFKDTATTEIYTYWHTLSLHDALPIFLRKGDGMFIPAGAGYAYQAGAKGVEVLEFRGATHFSFLFKNNTPAHWQQIADVLRDNGEKLHAEVPPSEH